MPVHSCPQILYIEEYGQEQDLCLLKIDMRNAFNECDRSTFLLRVGWVQWLLHISTTPLRTPQVGPLLLSLVVLDGIDLPQEMLLQLWYLDNGSFVRSQVVVFNLLAQISARGPRFALHMNLKCKVFWPSGDQYFPKFPDEVRRIGDNQDGEEILGTPFWGTTTFLTSCMGTCVEKTLELQSHLGDLEDSQVKLHLLRSCLGVCKLGHLL